MNTPSSLQITKLSAAERQIKAAIRMFFAREDSLAVHTVAAAGYQLLADLKAKRAMNEAADVHLTSIFYPVRGFRRGTLPKSITENLAVMARTRTLMRFSQSRTWTTQTCSYRPLAPTWIC